MALLAMLLRHNNWLVIPAINHSSIREAGFSTTDHDIIHSVKIESVYEFLDVYGAVAVFNNKELDVIIILTKHPVLVRIIMTSSSDANDSDG